MTEPAMAERADPTETQPIPAALAAGGDGAVALGERRTVGNLDARVVLMRPPALVRRRCSEAVPRSHRASSTKRRCARSQRRRGAVTGWFKPLARN